MTESGFLARHDVSLGRQAKKLSRSSGGRLDDEDLYQEGAIALIALYRRRPGTPDARLANCVAWRAMIDAGRRQLGRRWRRLDLYPADVSRLEAATLPLDAAIDIAGLMGRLARSEVRGAQIALRIERGETGREIGSALRLSEGRISQLKTAGIASLRDAARLNL